MTTTEDEITNIRRSLEHIRQWCDHEMKNSDNPIIQSICGPIRDMARAALKTPRATEIHVHITGGGLPPVSQP